MKGGGVSKLFRDLKRVCWPLNFKPSGIEKYDASTNPTEWLEVYQLAIEATGRDSYAMANYLSVCLPSSARTWLLGLPAGLVRSWSYLCRQFIINFWATCVHLGVTGTWPAWYERRETSSRSLFSAFATRGTSSWRSTENQSSCSSRRYSKTRP
jgi:hypothetical protein